ncbi:MAG TPA: phosphate ABC transporter permease subunit PstC [Alphaproteobacteria bacterium]
MFTTTLLCILGLAAFGYLAARLRARRLAAAGGVRLHSLPGYHGAFVALWVGIPSIVLVLIWVVLQGPVIDRLILDSMPDALTADVGSGRQQLLVSEVKSVAAGRIFTEPSAAVLAAADRYNQWQGLARWAMFAAALTVALLALVWARARLAPAFRARHGVERILNGVMIVCSLIAILTTLGIVLSLLFEALRFFDRVPWYEFFFGLNWEPQMPIREDQVAGLGAFGAVPVFTGTLLAAALAMLVAVPVGLLSAVYMAEYATARFRATVKPVLEILAGIPTVVYGFFAVLTVAPALRQFGAALGLDIAPNSAFAAGAVMGIMLIPFVSSLSDDALAAVPWAMREGAYGLGATKAETVVSVLLPAALPGIVGGILLALSRAIGETMIVVMAAGLIATLTANPFEAVTTVTVQIVTLLIGDTEFDSPKTLAAFALGLVLFAITLALNVIALRVVQKYREKYD